MENERKIKNGVTKELAGNIALYHLGAQPKESGTGLDNKDLDKDLDTDLNRILSQPKAERKHQIAALKSYEAMYQLWESRANVIEWMPLQEGAAVLELGAGCGTITNVLLQKKARVTCQEENLAYARLNAKRQLAADKFCQFEIFAMPYDSCEEMLGEGYDYIFAIGCPLFAQPDMLKRLGRHLKPDGAFIIALDNQFGLKYFAGCKEEATSQYFTGLEGRGGVKRYTRRGLEKELALAGFADTEFYYPYPDYRFTRDIYSDRYLPRKGDLNYNIANYADDRLILFDEEKVYDSILEDGQFPLFANAFLCVAKRGGMRYDPGCLYIRYASDRAMEYAMRTDIRQTAEGRKVYKSALYEEGSAHAEHIEKAYEKLCRQYENTGFCFNRLRRIKRGVIEFEYLEGEPLQEIVQKAALREDWKKVFDILGNLAQYIRSGKNNRQFVVTDDFARTFGEIDTLPFEGELCCEASDIDLTLSNIIVNKEGEWNVIDYEWTFFFPIPQSFLIYRTLFFLHLANPGKTELSMENLLAFSGIKTEQAQAYAKMESAFQSYVTAGQTPQREMVNLLGRKYRNIVQLESDYEELSVRYQTLKSAGLYKAVRKLKNCFRSR